MQIPKDKIVAMLKERGEDDKAAQAEQELPDQVDHEEHADLLQKHGLDTKDVLGKVGL
jgi:hypothetical protein